MSNMNSWGQPPQGGDFGGFAPPPPGGPPGGPPAGPPGNDGYEFSPEENVVIGECAKWGTVLAIIYFVLAALNVCNLCGKPLEASINIATYVLVGIFIILSAGALKAVVNTQGNDVHHMLDALEKLGNMFLVRLIAFVVSLVLVLIALSVAVVSMVHAQPPP